MIQGSVHRLHSWMSIHQLSYEAPAEVLNRLEYQQEPEN
uniref:Uncharacterized protein n=1 Tax=Cucumis melo TaxID=3656 RepID=A0A9I9ED45_CUCME